jgi:NADH dehydrogenase
VLNLKLDQKIKIWKNAENFVINFFKQIFVWWHKQTIGTFIYTLFYGKFVGKDEFNNRYFSSSKGKRWVIYDNRVEPSKIPPDWHLWIHFLTDNKPSNEKNKFKWQRKHEENLTGTERKHQPEGMLSSDLKKYMEKYETWKS